MQLLRRTPLTIAGIAVLLLVVTSCSAPLQKRSAADRTTPPKLGACYRLTPEDTDQPSSAASSVSCGSAHTAETFAIGTLPASTGKAYGAAAHGKYVYTTCEKAFEKFLGVDSSMALRVQLSWAWFRPSQRGWDHGARWYRCDLVGGPEDASSYAALPTSARGLFRAKPPEQWLTCAQGPSVSDSKKVPCTEKHDWRAVTSIKVGKPEDPYPGDRLVEVKTRDYCSDSVGAWMNYPVGYEFGYTWFHEAEGQAGNRLSVCWAKTDG
jgi:hypothetical protein